jgi:hypothetical protein
MPGLVLRGREREGAREKEREREKREACDACQEAMLLQLSMRMGKKYRAAAQSMHHVFGFFCDMCV